MTLGFFMNGLDENQIALFIFMKTYILGYRWKTNI